MLAFDRPSSFLGVLGQAGLREIGLRLDKKIDTVMRIVIATGYGPQVHFIDKSAC
jgi:hypothetical protein